MSHTREGLRKGMSNPKVVTKKTATGAGNMTRLSPIVDGEEPCLTYLIPYVLSWDGVQE